MDTFNYYTEECSLCGKRYPKRMLNKLYISQSHTSAPSPKKICSVCDDCLPALCDFFEISLPDLTVQYRSARRYCKVCYSDVSKRALYCQSCGNKLTEE